LLPALFLKKPFEILEEALYKAVLKQHSYYYDIRFVQSSEWKKLRHELLCLSQVIVEEKLGHGSLILIVFHETGVEL
jgi:hypothetical protein